MQGFIHLVLAFLFITSVMGQTQPTTTSTTITPTSTGTATSNTGSPSTSGSPTTQNAGGSTATSAQGSNTTGAVESTTTGQVYLCDNSSCSSDSLCVNLNNEYFCLCKEGYYYKDSKCNPGKIFPGKLNLITSYIPEMRNKTSLAYQQLHFNVTQLFERALKESGYGQTIINKVSPSISKKYDSYVEVTVVNILNETITLTENQVNEAVWKETGKLFPNVFYINQSMCDYYNCEKNNDGSNCDDSFNCVCKSGMYRPNPQASHCVPDPCPQSCTSKSNKHCQWNAAAGLANCVCLPDYMEDRNGICQKCAFGYSGVNCQDNLQLILTLVGSIAGVCIVVLVIALIIMGSKSREKKSEKQNLVGNDFQNMALEQTEFSKPHTGGNLFPKALTTPSRQPDNPYNFSSPRSFPGSDY